MPRFLSTDLLNRAIVRLGNNERDRRDFAAVVTAIIETDKYQRWLEYDQYFGRRFDVPRNLRVSEDVQERVLEKHSVIQDEYLELKAHFHGDHLFCTDGLWVPGDIRVFPFSDESERLVEFADRKGLVSSADVLIDPATGCGHHLVALANIRKRVAFDINPRAAAFARLNSLLNDTEEAVVGINEEAVVGINDLRRGLPRFVVEETSGSVLFLVNMPFALAPAREDLPLSAFGGRSGMELTLAALQAIRTFIKDNEKADSVHACVLAYSLGRVRDGMDDTWAVWDEAKDLFPSGGVYWYLLRDEQMWRINGRKEQPNPMPLESLELKANCRAYVPDDRDRAKVRAGYQRLTTQFQNEDWNVLGYGILELVLR